MMKKNISKQALNRATIVRQCLHERQEISCIKAIKQLAGLNAQHGLSPYVSLWARLKHFEPMMLETALMEKSVVKAGLMRSTLHIVTASDYLGYRPASQNVLLRAFRSFFPIESRVIDYEKLANEAKTVLTREPMAFRQLEKVLMEQFPGIKESSLSFGARAILPLVQLPPAGFLNQPGSPQYALACQWLHRELKDATIGANMLFLAYLRGFGPATSRDFQQWSGLNAQEVKPVIECCSRWLGTYEDEDGNTLYDLKGAILPDTDMKLPPRLLPRWDNLLLAYDDRSRAMSESYRQHVIQRDGRVLPTVLIDGYVQGIWDHEATRKQARMSIQLFSRIDEDTSEALQQEADELLTFLCPQAAKHEVIIRDFNRLELRAERMN
jgi:hypothetical protein